MQTMNSIKMPTLEHLLQTLYIKYGKSFPLIYLKDCMESLSKNNIWVNEHVAVDVVNKLIRKQYLKKVHDVNVHEQWKSKLSNTPYEHLLVIHPEIEVDEAVMEAVDTYINKYSRHINPMATIVEISDSFIDEMNRQTSEVLRSVQFKVEWYTKKDKKPVSKCVVCDSKARRYPIAFIEQYFVCNKCCGRLSIKKNQPSFQLTEGILPKWLYIFHDNDGQFIIVVKDENGLVRHLDGHVNHASEFIKVLRKLFGLRNITGIYLNQLWRSITNTKRMNTKQYKQAKKRWLPKLENIGINIDTKHKLHFSKGSRFVTTDPFKDFIRELGR